MPIPYPMESFKSFNPLFHIFDLLISESFICSNYSTLLFLPCNSNKRIAIILTIEILHLCNRIRNWILRDPMASKRATICGLLVLVMEASLVSVAIFCVKAFYPDDLEGILGLFKICKDVRK